jgi:uncharacterized linocin/CFP29 family protein
MSHLHRHLAPISGEAWAQIEEEAKRTLTTTLAARKLIDFEGPKGWDKSAVATGRVKAIEPGPRAGVTAAVRQTLPLIELRAVFELSRSELDAVDRGAENPDLDPVIAAARQIALAEDGAVFHGYSGGGIAGIVEEAPGGSIPITHNYEDYPVAVAQAITRLRNAGVDGPYAIALGPQCYVGLTDSTKNGYPVIQHVRRLIDGPIVYAPAVDGAVVLSMRGGDFKLTVGGDFSIGYLDHTAATVTLYLEESFTFQVLSPQAAVRLAYSDGKKK